MYTVKHHFCWSNWLCFHWPIVLWIAIISLSSFCTFMYCSRLLLNMCTDISVERKSVPLVVRVCLRVNSCTKEVHVFHCVCVSCIRVVGVQRHYYLCVIGTLCLVNSSRRNGCWTRWLLVSNSCLWAQVHLACTGAYKQDALTASRLAGDYYKHALCTCKWNSSGSVCEYGSGSALIFTIFSKWMKFFFQKFLLL